MGQKIVDLSSVELSMLNPRFTTITSLETNLLEDLINGNKNYNETEIIKTLLEREGNLKDFLSLVKSITTMGFDPDIEEILAIEKKGKFVIAEGNRRILALKLLNEKVSMPKKELIQNNSTIDINLADEEDNHDEAETFSANYEKIIKLISEYKKEWKNDSVQIRIIEEDKKLWKLIYTKHIAGERPGMRKWPRGKYFVDILNFFPKGFHKSKKELINKLLLTQIQRSIDSVKRDFQQAQFVRDIFWNEYNFEQDKLEEVYERMKTQKVSALQTNFSMKRIKDVAIKNLYMSKEELDKKFKIEYDENMMINYIDDVLSKTKVFDFILKWYNCRAITTRPIRDSLKLNFIKAVSNMLKQKEIKDIVEKERAIQNAFSYSVEDLEQLIDHSKKPENKKLLESISNVIKNNDQMLSVTLPTQAIEIKDEDPMSVFITLQKQLKHNIDAPIAFLNAVGATMRSILEQVFIWGGFFDLNAGGIVHSIISGSSSDEVKQAQYINDMAVKGIHKIFVDIRQITNNNSAGATIIKNIILNITSMSKENALLIAEFISEKDEEINSVLNESIHASHRIYSLPSLQDFLVKFELWQKNLIQILKTLNFSRIQSISNKIKTKIENI